MKPSTGIVGVLTHAFIMRQIKFRIRCMYMNSTHYASDIKLIGRCDLKQVMLYMDYTLFERSMHY